MTAELDIYGVFVPALFAWLLLAYGVHLILSRFLTKVGFYRFVWHRPLFDASLYVVLTAAVVLIVRENFQ
jgi:Protein of unknown function (DUF1656)